MNRQVEPPAGRGSAMPRRRGPARSPGRAELLGAEAEGRVASIVGARPTAKSIALWQGADDTEQLKTGLGLIVIVTRIEVTAPSGQKKTFTPNEEEVLESVIHEISAHAGRASEHQPDTHGTLAVDQIADEVAQFFRSSDKSEQPTPRATVEAIVTFLATTPGAGSALGPKGRATPPKP